MSMTVSEFKDNLTGMLHGGTLNKVRNIASAMKRGADTMLTRVDPVGTIRTAALNNTIHTDIYNYPLASDFKKLIDLYPQNNRTSLDTATRNLAEGFDLKKKLADKTISIEGSEGSKILRVNWRGRTPKTISEVDDLTSNGSWLTFGTTSGLVADAIDFVSGNGALRFDLAASGDGVRNISLNMIDLTDEDEVGDFFLWFKVKNATDLANLNSVTLTWGNDVTANYWTGVAQTTQADGTAFKVGWNQIKVPWSTASETGTVAPATIDSVKVTFSIDAAISDMRIDNIVCSIGRNFDHKYYSKYLLKNTSGTWIEKTTSDDDIIVLDSDEIQIYILETFIACAHQIEGADSASDIAWAQAQLYGKDRMSGLYAKYRSENPSMSKKAISSYGSSTTRRFFRK